MFEGDVDNIYLADSILLNARFSQETTYWHSCKKTVATQREVKLLMNSLVFVDYGCC